MQDFYKFLDENNYFWDRKDAKHVWVALNGYKCFDEPRLALDAAAIKAKAILISSDFDKHSGKTIYVFKHK